MISSSINSNRYSFLVETPTTAVLLDCCDDMLTVLEERQLLKSPLHIMMPHIDDAHHAIDLPRLAEYLCQHEGNRICCYLPKIETREPNLLLPSLECHEINATEDLFIDDLQIAFHRNLNVTTSYAVKIMYQNQVIVFSSETIYHDRLAGFAYDADVLIAGVAEATSVRGDHKMNALEVSDLINATQPSLAILVPDASVCDDEALLEIVRKNTWQNVILAQSMTSDDLKALDQYDDPYQTMTLS